MEPARPALDRWLLHWLQSATFSKRDFREDIYGFIRATHPLNSHLAMTAALWRGIAEQLAQRIYKRLSGETAHLGLSALTCWRATLQAAPRDGGLAMPYSGRSRERAPSAVKLYQQGGASPVPMIA
jgi:hypothetical protein